MTKDLLMHIAFFNALFNENSSIRFLYYQWSQLTNGFSVIGNQILHWHKGSKFDIWSNHEQSLNKATHPLIHIHFGSWGLLEPCTSHQIDTKQPFTPTGNLEFPFELTCMFFGPCAISTQAGIKPTTFFMWGDRAPLRYKSKQEAIRGCCRCLFEFWVS